MARTIARGLTALALGGLTSLTMISPAHAAPCPPATYPPGVPCIPFTITVTVVVDGQTFTITVGGYKAGSAVEFVIHSSPKSLGTFTADAAGNVTATLQLPTDVPAGQHVLTASGVGPDGKPRILSSPLAVKAKSAGSGIPFTGFELGAASLLGAGLLGAGTIALVSGRKRQSGGMAAA